MKAPPVQAVRAPAVPRHRVQALKASPPEWKIHWILRLAIACEFIAHGAFGIIGKEAWLS